jgi:hypothetical protein
MKIPQVLIAERRITCMINYSGSPSRANTGAPKDGQERSVIDSNGAAHLEYFMQGSWRHDRTRCRQRTNKECTR